MYRHNIEDCCCCGQCMPKSRCQICGCEIEHGEELELTYFDVVCERCYEIEKEIEEQEELI